MVKSFHAAPDDDRDLNKVAKVAAAWTADFLRQYHYQADGTPWSLWEVERFLLLQTDGPGRVRELFLPDVAQRVYGLGAYVGEVIRRARGGTWAGEGYDPVGGSRFELVLDNGVVADPVALIRRRMNGEFEAIITFARSLQIEVGERNERTTAKTPRGWWSSLHKVIARDWCQA